MAGFNHPERATPEVVDMNRLMILLALLGPLALSGCMAPAPKPNDPYYAPVLPRTPLPASQNNGSIYQAGFENNLFGDRKAYRVGDIITITLNERTQASKNSNSQISKDSSANLGVPNLFGMAVSPKNPLAGLSALGMTNDTLGLDASFDATRSADGSGQAGQSNSLTGSITVSVAEVMPQLLLHPLQKSPDPRKAGMRSREHQVVRGDRRTQAWRHFD